MKYLDLCICKYVNLFTISGICRHPKSHFYIGFKKSLVYFYNINRTYFIIFLKIYFLFLDIKSIQKVHKTNVQINKKLKSKISEVQINK